MRKRSCLVGIGIGIVSLVGYGPGIHGSEQLSPITEQRKESLLDSNLKLVYEGETLKIFKELNEGSLVFETYLETGALRFRLMRDFNEKRAPLGIRMEKYGDTSIRNVNYPELETKLSESTTTKQSKNEDPLSNYKDLISDYKVAMKQKDLEIEKLLKENERLYINVKPVHQVLYKSLVCGSILATAAGYYSIRRRSL